MSARSSEHGAADHSFGGGWTDQKLKVLADYLSAYSKALRHKPTPTRPFRRIYIDAFAGSGYRTAHRAPLDGESLGGLLFPDLAEDEPAALLDGSARLALRTDPPFDGYVFIDISPSRCEALEALKSEFPRLADRIDIRQGDANETIQSICTGDWRSRRAVLFLDPSACRSSGRPSKPSRPPRPSTSGCSSPWA